MPLESLNEIIARTRKRLALGAHVFVRPTTVPIYSKTIGKPTTQHGSALLLEHKSKKILVTAAHVFDCTHGTSYWIGGQNGLIGVTGDNQLLHCLDEPHSTKPSEIFDLAAIELNSEQIEALKGMTFIPMHSIGTCNQKSNERLLIVFGYPNSRNKSAVLPNRPRKQHSICFSTVSQASADWVGKFDFNIHQNFLMAAPTYSTDENGAETKTISLRGMSGGPIVDLGDWMSEDVLAERRTPVPKIVGVLTRHIRKQEILVGSQLKSVLTQLFEQVS